MGVHKFIYSGFCINCWFHLQKAHNYQSCDQNVSSPADPLKQLLEAIAIFPVQKFGSGSNKGMKVFFLQWLFWCHFQMAPVMSVFFTFTEIMPSWLRWASSQGGWDLHLPFSFFRVANYYPAFACHMVSIVQSKKMIMECDNCMSLLNGANGLEYFQEALSWTTLACIPAVWSVSDDPRTPWLQYIPVLPFLPFRVLSFDCIIDLL